MKSTDLRECRNRHAVRSTNPHKQKPEASQTMQEDFKAATLAHEILPSDRNSQKQCPSGMRFLQFSPPNLAEVHEALDCVVKDV